MGRIYCDRKTMCHGLTCIILTVFNTATFAAGLVMLIAGALLRWNKAIAIRVFLFTSEQVQDTIPPETQRLVDNAIEKIQEMSSPIGYVLFFVGFTLLLISLIAFVGLCCQLRLALIIYAALIGALLTAHSILLIVYFTNKHMILNPIYTTLEVLVKGYKSIDSEETTSAVLGILMPTFECCGYNNGEDFRAADARFTGKDFFNGTNITLEYPLPCCKTESLGLGVGECPKSFNEANSYIQVGCRDILDADFCKKMDIVMYNSLIALAIEALTFAAVIIHLWIG